MKEIELTLESQFWRPMIRLYGKLALIDTGAIVPVISMSKDMLNMRFHAKLIRDNVSISGFGGGKSYGNIYSLSDFYINTMRFAIMECFVPYERDKEFPLILSVSLFYHTHYEFRADEGKMIIRIPDDNLQNNEFLIKNLSDKICVQLNGVLYQM